MFVVVLNGGVDCLMLMNLRMCNSSRQYDVGNEKMQLAALALGGSKWCSQLVPGTPIILQIMHPEA